MRFAGSRIEGFLGDSPDFGKVAQNAGVMQSKEKAAITGLQGKVASAGIGAAAEVESAGIVGAAQASAASDYATGSMFGALGQIGSAAIGTIPTGGGGIGGSGIGSGITGTVGGDGGSAAGYFNNYGDERLVNWMK